MIGDIFKSISSIVDKFVPGAGERKKLKAELASLVLEAESAYIKQVAELMKQGSGIKWIDGIKHLIRPGICVIMFLRLVSSWFGAPALSQNEWWILQGAVGFYFLSRGAEKIIRKAL